MNRPQPEPPKDPQTSTNSQTGVNPQTSVKSKTLDRVPRRYRQMHQSHPELMRAYEDFGAATRSAGPLSEREIALVKLAISIGANLEGAAHSHCRKAIGAGCDVDDLMHVATLSGPTMGFPAMMRARGWVSDIADGRPKPNDAPENTTRGAAHDEASESSP